MSDLHTFTSPPTPLTISIPEKEVDDLNLRLDNARWPKVDTVPDDSNEKAAFGLGHGPTLHLMKELAAGWRSYSWKKKEEELNR